MYFCAKADVMFSMRSAAGNEWNVSFLAIYNKNSTQFREKWSR